MTRLQVRDGGKTGVGQAARLSGQGLARESGGGPGGRRGLGRDGAYRLGGRPQERGRRGGSSSGLATEGTYATTRRTHQLEYDETGKSFLVTLPPPEGIGRADETALRPRKQGSLRRRAFCVIPRYEGLPRTTRKGGGLHQLLRFDGGNRASSDGSSRSRPGPSQGHHQARGATDRKRVLRYHQVALRA